jgi:hypothetical protein
LGFALTHQQVLEGFVKVEQAAIAFYTSESAIAEHLPSAIAALVGWVELRQNPTIQSSNLKPI